MFLGHKQEFTYQYTCSNCFFETLDSVQWKIINAELQRCGNKSSEARFAGIAEKWTWCVQLVLPRDLSRAHARSFRLPTTEGTIVSCDSCQHGQVLCRHSLIPSRGVSPLQMSIQLGAKGAKAHGRDWLAPAYTSSPTP